METKLNNVRFQLDFGMIPKIFYKDPVDFIVRSRRVKGEFICALYNRYYEVLNPMYFPDRPKHFVPGDFTVEEKAAHKLQFMRITLPSEHEGSLEFCTEYIIAWQKGFLGMKKPQLYAVERTPLGLRQLGAMHPDGTHSSLGQAGMAEENLAAIANAAFDK